MQHQKDKAEEFLSEISSRYTDDELRLIEKALDIARKAHEGQLRRSGDPHFYHGLEVARILYQLKMDCPSLCAGLLHDVLEDTAIDFEFLKKHFPMQVSQFVEGITKISTLHFFTAREEYVENLRKMILAMAKDIRVIIIKLADRLHNMRTLKYLPEDRIRAIARDTLDIYSPLANRLGMARIKSELEDLAMIYLYPEDYRAIAGNIARKKENREEIVKKAILFLENHLSKRGIEAVVEGRSKHFYSIYQKMKTQGLSFDEIFDLTALRIITKTVEDCYDVLGLVHSFWRPIPGRLKDYIALPKENMYQSIHTAVVGLGGERIEIQIRTFEMNTIAEEGIAAHWKYKEGKTGLTDLDEKLRWVRQLTEWIKDVRDPGEFMDALEKDVFADIVFCFTPKGDVIELPKGSTPLDFAYHIHSEIGDHCVGARVNKRFVPLKVNLQNGDMVEILTSKSAHPSSGWLEYVKTSRARNKIRHYLRATHFEENVTRGEDMLIKAVKDRNVTIASSELEGALEPYLRALKVNSYRELLAEIGFGTVLPVNVVDKLAPKLPPQPRVKGARKARVTGPGITVDGIDRTLVRFARCCNPLPGEEIVGFVTRGRGITIHSKDCRSLKRIIDGSNDGASRALEAQWNEQCAPTRKVSLRVIAQKRIGLLKDVFEIISSMGITITESQSKVLPRKNQSVLKFLLEVKHTNEINDLLQRLRTVKGVTSLSRVVR